MQSYQKKLFIIFILIGLSIGAFLHLWRLRTVPMSLYYDEMDYVITGEAIARFGTDLSGQWKPSQLIPLHTLNITGELPAVYHAIFQKIFGLGVDSARYPATFFGLLSIFLCMAITHLILKDKKTTLLVAVVMALNPWHVHISRSGYEAMIAVAFQLSFILNILIYLDRRFTTKWKIGGILLALLSLFLGFYAYHAAKFTLLSLGIVSLIFIWFYQKDKKLNLIFTVSLLFLMSLLAYRTYSLNTHGYFGARQEETVIDASSLSEKVDFLRRESLYLPGNSLFMNKATVLVESLIKHYLSVFDIYRLFVNGLESTYQFSLIVHGFFYLSTVLLVLVAFWYMVKNKQTRLIPLLILFLVSPVASVVSVGYQSIFRSSLTYSLMLVFAGIGLSTLLFEVFKKLPRYTVILQNMMYCFLIGEAIIFGFRYFSQYPILSADNQFFFEKLLAGYVIRQDQPVIVVAERYAYSYARAFIAYNQLMPTLTQQEREQFANPRRNIYSIGNVTFTHDCPDQNTMSSSVLQVVESGKYQSCKYDLLDQPSSLVQDSTSKIALGSPIDSRPYFYLMNDTTCNGVPLNPFIYNNQLSDFDVIHLDDRRLCERWVRTE